MRIFGLLIAILIVHCDGNVAFANNSNDAAIRHVLNDFITGWREGDAKLMDDAANLEHGHAIWLATNDENPTVTSTTFGKMIEGLQPHPDYGVPYEILSINIVGDELAFANIAAQQGDRGTILDYFTLMKVDDRWEVIALEWLWRPGMLVSAEQLRPEPPDSD